MKAADDPRILQRYLERPNRRRFERLVRAYQGFVYATAFRVTRNAADAHDISQDVFLQLLLEPPPPESVRSAAAFLAWRVVGRATNLRRAAERRREREARGRRFAGEDAIPEEQLEALRSAVEALPDALRVTVELRYFAGVQNEDIALVLGLSTRAVEERLRSAREILRRNLAPSTLGLLAAMEGLESSANDVPVKLTQDLLHLARAGTAFLAARTTLHTGIAGGALMTKKIAAVAGAALVVAGLVSVGRLREEPPETRPERTESPLSVVESRTESIASDAAATDLAVLDVDRVAPAEPDRAVLRGRVWDDEENLVPGARLIFRQTIEEEGAEELRGAGFAVDPGVVESETESDEAGEYVLSGLLPHRGRFSVEKEPYIACGIYSARPEAGKEKQSDIILCHPYRVHGTVRSADGRELRGAEILISANVLTHIPKGKYPYWREFPADENGGYDTGRIVPVYRRYASGSDPLRVLAMAEGRVIVEKRIRREEFDDYERRVDFVLAAEVPTVVHVTDPGGLPVEGVSIRIASERRLLVLPVVTDTGGTGRIEHLGPEERRLALSKDGYYDTSVQVDPETSQHVEVVLKPYGPAVAGRVLFDDRLPAPEREPGKLVFELVRPDNGFEFQNIWDVPMEFDKETLAYRFFPLEAGRYSIRREHGLVVSRTEPFDYDGARPVSVDLPVRLEPPYVTGRVVRAGSDEPIAGLPVVARFLHPEGSSRSTWGRWTIIDGFSIPGRPGNATATRTDDEGRFLMLLPKERFDFWSSASSRVVLRAESDEIGTTGDFEFLFDAGTVIDDIRLELAMGAIEGLVLGLDGTPSAGEILVASNLEGTTTWALADRDGRFRLEKLPPGDYFIEALGSGPAPRTGGGGGSGLDTDDLPPPHEFFPRPVGVAPGRTTEWTIDLRRDGLGKLRGTVAADLARAEDLHVEASMMVAGRPLDVHALVAEGPVIEGTFEIEHLRPGPYRVTLRKGRGVLAHAEATIARATTSEVHLIAYRSSVFVPIETDDGDSVGGLEVRRVERGLFRRSAGEWRWETCAGYEVSRERGGLRISGLPEATVRIGVLADGFEETWSAAIPLSDEETEAVGPPMVLVRTRDPEG